MSEECEGGKSERVSVRYGCKGEDKVEERGSVKRWWGECIHTRFTYTVDIYEEEV